jgi:hypothetical protein
MSEKTASSIDTLVLYIRLLNEGTEVMRPTTGRLLAPNLVQILPTSDYDPAVEEWEFPPGTKVRFVTETQGDREVFVARQRVA